MAEGPDRFTYFNRAQDKMRKIHGVSRVEDAGENDDGSAEFNIFLSADMAIRIEEEQREEQNSDWLQGIKQELAEKVNAEVKTFDESQHVLHVVVPYTP